MRNVRSPPFRETSAVAADIQDHQTEQQHQGGVQLHTAGDLALAPCFFALAITRWFGFFLE